MGTLLLLILFIVFFKYIMLAVGIVALIWLAIYAIALALESPNTFHSNRPSVYFIEAIGTGQIKIGFSNNPTSRIKTLQTGSASKLILLGCINSDQSLESHLHGRFAHLRQHGEWFTATNGLRNYVQNNTRTRTHTKNNSSIIKKSKPLSKSNNEYDEGLIKYWESWKKHEEQLALDR